MISDEEKRRLKAVQDAVRAAGDPQTPEDLSRMFDAMREAASGKPVDPELAKKRELARALEKWRKP